MNLETSKRKHVRPDVVASLKIIQLSRRIPDKQLAFAAGCSRCLINRMMNRRVPFQKKYLEAVESILLATDNLS